MTEIFLGVNVVYLLSQIWELQNGGFGGGREREISEGYMDTTTEKQGPIFLLCPGF